MAKGRIPPDAKGMITFHVSSGFGGNTHKPFVEVEVGEQSTQMSPASARALALNLLEAADAAESDGFVLSYLMKTFDLSIEQAATMLRDFRAHRAKLRGEGVTSA